MPNKNTKLDLDSKYLGDRSLRDIANQFKKIQVRAKKLGLFAHDRALLSCPHCELKEDIAFTGECFTYRNGDKKFKDTGLRFIALDKLNKQFKCPHCGTKFKAPEELNW